MAGLPQIGHGFADALTGSFAASFAAPLGAALRRPAPAGGLRRGLVVLTKVDLVDSEWIELVQADVLKTINKTSLADAPVIRVSAVTGEGIGSLVAALDMLLEKAEPRPDLGRPRLPIDRVFTMSGFGTVVTGTLVDGRLNVGDELEVVPSGRLVRVRGLQRHNTKVIVENLR